MTRPKAASVSISYAHQDRSNADLLKGYLLARDHRVSSDEDIESGDGWADSVTKALEDSTVVVLLLSPHYLQSESSLYEAGVALGKLRHQSGKVIPIIVGEVNPEDIWPPLRRASMLDARGLGRRELLGKLDDCWRVELDPVTAYCRCDSR